MFNERSPFWEVTDERLDALSSIPSGMDDRHSDTLSEMVGAAVDGAARWNLTTERYVAIKAYLTHIRMPSFAEIRDVAKRMQLGGIRDGVADRQWFVEAMDLFLKIEGET